MTIESFAVAKIVMRPPAGGDMKLHKPNGVCFFPFSNLQSIFFQTADPECLQKKPWLSNLCVHGHHLGAAVYTCRFPPHPEIPVGEIRIFMGSQAPKGC